MGILTVAGSALSSGVGTAGSVLASTAKVVGGLKTLALLGIGTSELNFWSFHFLIHPFNFVFECTVQIFLTRVRSEILPYK